MADNGLILAGDIGGTKTNLGLFTDRGDCVELVKEASFVNVNYKSHEEIIGEFISKGDASRIESASLGIACPVEANRCRMTNLPWVVDGAAIKRKLRIKRLELINDLVATGWGVGLLSKDDMLVLQPGNPRPGNAALIAAGTGLGEAILFWNGQSHLPAGSEGGHADFAPKNALEMEFLSHLMARFGHVSYERALSGPGIENIYRFLKARRRQRPPERLMKRFEAEGVAPVVSEEALSGRDAACREALEMFISIYGSEAGNLALKSMAVNGVYIGGGIAPKIAGLMGRLFLDAFVKKGRFERLLSEIPVYLILNEKTALLGAARYAVNMLREGGAARIKKAVLKDSL